MIKLILDYMLRHIETQKLTYDYILASKPVMITIVVSVYGIVFVEIRNSIITFRTLSKYNVAAILDCHDDRYIGTHDTIYLSF